MKVAPRRCLGLLLAVAASLAATQAWPAALTEAQVRAFFAEQQRAWNAGNLGAYFKGFQPDAIFIDQYRTPAGEIVPYGSSTLAKARVQTHRSRALARISETRRMCEEKVESDCSRLCSSPMSARTSSK